MSILGAYLKKVTGQRDEAVALLKKALHNEHGTLSETIEEIKDFLERFEDRTEDYDEA